MSKLFFPEIELTRSPNTETGHLLYAANLSNRYGPGANQSLYIETSVLPMLPNTLKMMLYDDAPPTIPSALVLELHFNIEEGNTYRYREVTEPGEEQVLGLLPHFRKEMFTDGPLDVCFLEIKVP